MPLSIKHMATVVTKTALALEQKMAWVYLVNLVFYLLPMFTVSYTWWQLLLQLMALLLFIGCYFYAYRQTNRQMLWPILAMLIIATAMTPLNYGTISMFAYASFFISFAYRLPVAIAGIAGVCLLLVLLKLNLNIQWHYFLHYGLALICGIGLFGRVERMRQHHRVQQQQSADDIKQLATTVERERIARDLHDILGHTLSSIVLKADLANRLLDAGQTDTAQLHLQQLSQIARDSLSQVRQSVSGYRHHGLAGETSKLLSRLRDGGFTARLTGEIPKLDERTETALILVLTELVTNVLRHSKGDECQLSFTQKNNQLQLSVKDNGRPPPLQFGNGLTGITERLAALNATLSVSAEPCCEITITLPLSAGAQE